MSMEKGLLDDDVNFLGKLGQLVEYGKFLESAHTCTSYVKDGI